MSNLLLLILCVLQAILMVAICGVGVIALYFAFNSGFMRNPPPVPSTGKIKKAMIEAVARRLAKKDKQIVMDLGAGWGTLLLPLAKKFPKHTFVGIEYGYLPYIISKFRARKMPNLSFVRQNLFDADISKADVIFLFLLNSAMPKIENKCQKEAKPGALIYVNRFPMPNLKAKQEISFGTKYDTCYVYEIK
ncbi:MAG: hypothetical protein J6Y85_00435 [Alphaproteobacteria bacterium]|nr:hypothetical protein [Alphaproteobacteria bacterium]